MYRSAFQSLRLLRNTQTSISLPRLDPSKRFQFRGYSKSAKYQNTGTKRQDLISETISTSSSSSSSNRILIFGVPAVILGFVGVASFARYNDERRAINKGKDVKEGITVKGPIVGGPFTLINTKRQTVTEKDLLGNWVLLYFGYTSSPDIGPAEVQKMAKTVDTLESQQNVRLLPIFVTLDPQRDTPSQLDAYLKEYDSRIVGLTGPVNSVKQMAQEYRVFFKRIDEDGNDYLVETSHNMYLINPNMEIVRCFGTEYNAEELSEAIVKELKRSAR
ncbi:protein SCO1 homolog 2, mitochondrial [Silene latifolia]|uniref:protein SCO1 homolog 2, mitochondrial n=1 Tax=Silene latifolia TaxID=37657 RepID=UPI003D77AF1D